MGDPHGRGFILARGCLGLSDAGAVGGSAGDETGSLAAGGVLGCGRCVAVAFGLECCCLSFALGFFLVCGYLSENVWCEGQVLLLHEPTDERDGVLRGRCHPRGLAPGVDRVVQIGGRPTVCGWVGQCGCPPSGGVPPRPNRSSWIAEPFGCEQQAFPDDSG